LVLVGDYKDAIVWLNEKNECQKNKCLASLRYFYNGISDSLAKSRIKFYAFHVFRGLNGSADYMAQLGHHLESNNSESSNTIRK